MGRNKTIRIDDILDAAERVLVDNGPSFSIATVAKEAGISKGGVQSSIGTRESLLRALLERWLQQEEVQFMEHGGGAKTPAARIRAHINATRLFADPARSKAARAYAALLAEPCTIEETRQWYARRMQGLDNKTASARRARIAFMAAEGAFYTRFLGLMPMPSESWDAFMVDLTQFLAEPSDEP